MLATLAVSLTSDDRPTGVAMVKVAMAATRTVVNFMVLEGSWLVVWSGICETSLLVERAGCVMRTVVEEKSALEM